MKFQKIQQSAIVRYLSSISFTFFLCQILPIWTLSKVICTYMNSNNIVRIAISFSLCLCGAILIHERIEKPASKFLKKKLLKQ